MRTAYDPQCRNPLYAGAERCHQWEIESLRQHFHPSVALFAGHLASGTPIKYTGDPLTDFTLPKFLDRFVFRWVEHVERLLDPKQIFKIEL